MLKRTLMCFFLLLAPAMSQELKLVKTIPVSELGNESGVVPEIGTDRVTFRLEGVDNKVENEFGFFQMGPRLLLYTGANGMVVDVDTGAMSQALPSNLESAKVSPSGEWVIGMLNNQKRFWGMHKGIVREQKAERWCWFFWLGWIHPADDVFFAPDEAKYYPYPPHGLEGVMVVDLATGKILKRVPIEVPSGAGMEPTRDGKLIVGGSGSLDPFSAQKIRTGERISLDLPENSGDFVFNRDASWVAGEKGANDYSTFVWDRKTKKYLWKSRDVSTPYAFSPNDKYLLCDTMMVEVVTGKTAFDGLKGHRGKFSPDGRSLVTVDDQAFYIYTLPKDSEPIFGVFQKPAPWSPPSSKKPVKTPSQKTTQKP